MNIRNGFSLVNSEAFKIHDLSKIVYIPGWCGSVGWALDYELKGCWFNSQSGHMPGLWARSWFGGGQEATDGWFSCTLLFFYTSFFLSLSLKNEMSSLRKYFVDIPIHCMNRCSNITSPLASGMATESCSLTHPVLESEDSGCLLPTISITEYWHWNVVSACSKPHSRTVRWKHRKERWDLVCPVTNQCLIIVHMCGRICHKLCCYENLAVRL